jgi:hypothetical protein
MARRAYRSVAVALLVAGFLAIAVVDDEFGGAAPSPLAAKQPLPPRIGVAGETSRRGCDRFAGPHGSDRSRGNLRHPYRTVRRLARALRSGQTGCLLPGRYSHPEVARLDRPGVTLRGVGPGRPLILDPIWILPRAVGAGLYNIKLTTRDRVYVEPLKVQADRARIVGNVIFGGPSASCILVGSQNRVAGVTIERNVIRHCGRSGKFDHLIYVENARRTTIRWNLLTDNHGGWAVHLYPNADDSLVEHNVIDGNFGGVIIAGYGDDTSSGNLIRANAITYSGPRRNVEASWQGRFGSDNRVTANCLFSQSADAPSGIGERWGFSAGSNAVIGGSPYVDRTAGDYRFHSRSPCGGLVGDVADAVSASLR